ncbi:MAG: DUF1347 family protein [Victivallaceae bacterium]
MMSRYYVIALTAFFVIMGTTSGIWHFHNNQNKTNLKISKATSFFLTGKLDKGEKTLCTFPKEKQILCKQIYEGLRLQEKKNFEESEIIFNKAFQDLRLNKINRTDFTLTEDLLGGMLLNAFFQQKHNDFDYYWKYFKKHCPDSIFLELFEGMWSFTEKTFSKALDHICLWEKKHSAHPSLIETSWLSYNCSLPFIKQHLSLLKIKCLMETGELKKAYKDLNTLMDNLLKKQEDWNLAIYEEIALLSSRYYYLLSKKNDFYEKKNHYYEMMLFYLKKTNKLNLSSLKNHISSEEILSIVQELVTDMNDHNIELILEFIELSEQNYNYFQYGEIIKTFHELNEHENNHQTIIKYLKKLILSPNIRKFREQLTKHLADYMKISLHRLDMRKIRQYFAYLEILEPNISFTQRITMSTEDIQQILLCDGSNEPLTTYLSLWKKEQISSGDRKNLLFSLIEIAGYLWQQKRDAYALEIFKNILSMTVDKDEVWEEILNFINIAYQKAEAMQDISRLCLLDEFIFNHRLPPLLRNLSSEDIANLIADAEYFYMHQKNEKAMMSCNWLSKVYPNNEDIIRLTGLCLVKQKYYKEALNYFEKLSYEKKDTRVIHAISICMDELSLREL